jgi:hypothetical protein
MSADDFYANRLNGINAIETIVSHLNANLRQNLPSPSVRPVKALQLTFTPRISRIYEGKRIHSVLNKIFRQSRFALFV